MTAARVTLQALGWRSLVLDVMLLAGVGWLAAVMGCWGVQNPFDRALFASGMNYDHRMESMAPADGLGLLRVGGLVVAPVSDNGGSGGLESGDYFRARELTMMLTDPAGSAALDRLLGASLVAGNASGAGVLLDSANARLWHLAPGDRVSLVLVGADSISECVATISGLTRPYHSDSADTEGSGLLVVPSGLCGAVTLGHTANQGGIWESYDAPGEVGATWWHGIWQALDPRASATGTFMFAAGAALWAVACARVAGRSRARAGGPAATLVRCGLSPSKSRAALRAVVIAEAVICASLASAVSALLLARSVGTYIQAPQVVFQGLAMTVVVVVTATAMTQRWPMNTRHK
ncbi:MAG: hypothetical protein LBE08_13345 [Bifidobacteriaceae bacterium]|nr:hypothetical protein [Bifidobacteriaceae bacterium]